MKHAISFKKTNFLARWLSAPAENQRLLQEKSRLEAFLTAFPGEYCGWARDGSVAYSKGFVKILKLETVKTITDIQTQLSPGDAAALESMFDRLQTAGTPFVITAQNYDDTKHFKLSGSQGKNLQGNDTFNVIWIEDITAQVIAQKEQARERESRESELDRAREALNSLPRPLWMRDKDQNIIWCNETYAEFFELSKEEILTQQKELATSRRSKNRAAAEEDKSPGKALAAKALSSQETQAISAHAIVKGKRLLIRISEIPLSKHNMTVGIGYNITREEELEGELKRYQSSTRELLEQLSTAVAIFSGDEKLEFYNAAFAQLWGLEDQWLNTGPKLSEIMEKLREHRLLPEQADFRKFKQSWLDMFTRLIEPYDDMLYLPNGKALRMLAIPHSMDGLMMTFEDVTSRLELESSYNTLIAVQKETLDNLGEAVAVYGGDGRLKLNNPAFGRLWDLHPEDLEGGPHITKIVEKKKKFFDKETWDTRKKDLIQKGLDRVMHEGRLARNDGSLLDFSSVPLPDGGVLITYVDITDTVQVENALREKNAALETAEQLKLDFLANVSYQLRTPLNAIMGFNEILEQEYFGPLNERQKQYTQDINQASEKLLDLINDILDLSTLEAGYLTLEKESVKIYTMLGSVHDLVNEWARGENIEISVKCAKNIGAIEIDENRIKQALINLIRNAIAYTPGGGQITLTGKRKKTGIEITVADTGSGIPQDDLSRIFEPFERAQGPTAGRSGAGLGLALVKNIIDLHGGTIDIKSEVDKGTIVSMFLPFEKK